MAPSAKGNASRSVYSSDRRLKQALSRYLLTSGEGGMGLLITDLVSLHKHRETVNFVKFRGNADHSHDWLRDLLECWRISVVTSTTQAPTSETVHDLKIPDIKDRRGDLPKMIAYYFGDFLHRCEVTQSSIRQVSLDLLWYMLGNRKWKNFDAVRSAVEQSVMNAPGEVLTLCQAVSSARASGVGGIGALDNACEKLEDPQRDRKALGLLIKHSGWLEKDVRGKYVEWYLNWDTDEARHGDFAPRVPRIPTDRLYQAMTNIYKLSGFSEDTLALSQEELSRIEECFALRRQDLDEEAIAKRMEFEDFRVYQNWTEHHFINIRFRQRNSICAERHRAEASLLPPSKKSRNTLPYRENVAFDNKLHVVTIDGAPNELSPEQYRVYKCLVEVFPRALTWIEIQSVARVDHQQMAHTFARKKALRESIIVKVTEKGARVRWKAKLTET